MSHNAATLGHKPEGFRILLVDDDPNLLETTSALLEDEGNLLKARDGATALRLLTEHEVHLLCTDFQMPGMNGVELLRTARTIDPLLIGILMTGFRERLPRGLAGDPAIFAFLYKPYQLEALQKMVRDAARCAAMARPSGAFPIRGGRREPARRKDAK